MTDADLEIALDLAEDRSASDPTVSRVIRALVEECHRRSGLPLPDRDGFSSQAIGPRTMLQDLCFSVNKAVNTRILNALSDHDIDTVGDLVARTAADLDNCHWFGAQSLRLVRVLLGRHGLHLAGDPVLHFSARPAG